MLKSKKSAAVLSRLLKFSPREVAADSNHQPIKKHKSSIVQICLLRYIGLAIRHTDPVSASHNSPPFQLPNIGLEYKSIPSKTRSRIDGQQRLLKRRDKSNENKYAGYNSKKNNKSFVDTHSVSKKTLIATLADNAKNSFNKDVRHKSVERHELFDKHFSKVTFCPLC